MEKNSNTKQESIGKNKEERGKNTRGNTFRRMNKGRWHMGSSSLHFPKEVSPTVIFSVCPPGKCRQN